MPEKIMSEKVEKINENVEKQIVTMITPDGEEVDVEVLLFFELESNHKEYLIYTYNEKDKNNMITVYASSFVEEENSYHLRPIETEEELDQVKEVMRQAIKSGGDE